MFEEFIAQGNDMIRRLQKEVGLPSHWAESIPESERVTLIEANAWQQGIEERIKNSFGPDAYARYSIFWEVYKDDVKKGKGDASSRCITVWQRIVTYLVELDSRLAGKDGAAKGPESDETRKVG
jgi:hypothetical protein